jgi:hypothetical protein
MPPAVQQSNDVVDGVKGAARRQKLPKHVANEAKDR